METIRKNWTWIVLAMIVIYFIGRYFYKQPKYINGASAPDFAGQMYDDSSMKLSDLKGQYVLLDFWGSWCGPCVAEAPDLKKIYDTFHGKSFKDAKGFEIVSVGIESDKERWLLAIQKLNLNWRYHVSDFQNLDSPIAKQYGVRVIPTKFLLNTEGVIIGVNQSLADIETVLTSKLQ
jgi:thiol-disulfide isomerase/thioredoxin